MVLPVKKPADCEPAPWAASKLSTMNREIPQSLRSLPMTSIGNMLLMCNL